MPDDEELQRQRTAHERELAELQQQQSAEVGRQLLERFETALTVLERWPAGEPPPPEVTEQWLATLGAPLDDMIAGQTRWLRSMANVMDSGLRLAERGAWSAGSELERLATAMEQQAVTTRSVAAMVRVRDECRRRGWL